MSQGWQSEAAAGPKGAWGLLSFSLSFSDYLPPYLPIYLLCIYLSIDLSIYLSLSLSLFHLSICPAVYLSICLSIYLSISLSLSIYLSIYQFNLSFYLSISVCLSVCLSFRSDNWTSKSGPKPYCFEHFHFEMCFAPQRRACTFSTSELPKAVRRWGVFYMLTWKCASRHNGVQFFISHLASCLCTRRFSEPTFRPSGATNHWKKNTVFRHFPTFSHICIFFLLTLSLLIFSLLSFLFSLPLPCSAFHLPVLSEVWLLNFLPIVISDCNHKALNPKPWPKTRPEL